MVSATPRRWSAMKASSPTGKESVAGLPMASPTMMRPRGLSSWHANHGEGACGEGTRSGAPTLGFWQAAIQDQKAAGVWVAAVAPA